MPGGFSGNLPSTLGSLDFFGACVPHGPCTTQSFGSARSASGRAVQNGASFAPRNWEREMRGGSTACWPCKRFLAGFSTSCLLHFFRYPFFCLPGKLASDCQPLFVADPRRGKCILVIFLANVFCRPLSSFNHSFSPSGYTRLDA